MVKIDGAYYLKRLLKKKAKEEQQAQCQCGLSTQRKEDAPTQLNTTSIKTSSHSDSHINTISKKDDDHGMTDHKVNSNYPSQGGGASNEVETQTCVEPRISAQYLPARPLAHLDYYMRQKLSCELRMLEFINVVLRGYQAIQHQARSLRT